MKYNSVKGKSRLLLAIGLLLVSGPFIVARYAQVPDSLRGAMVGAGLAMGADGIGDDGEGKKSKAKEYEYLIFNKLNSSYLVVFA